MFLKTVVASVLLAAFAAPAVAQDNVASPATPAAKPAKPKKICRQEAETGSVMTTSTCHTREEWQQIDAANAAQGDRALQGLHRSTGMGH